MNKTPSTKIWYQDKDSAIYAGVSRALRANNFQLIDKVIEEMELVTDREKYPQNMNLESCNELYKVSNPYGKDKLLCLKEDDDPTGYFAVQVIDPESGKAETVKWMR